MIPDTTAHWTLAERAAFAAKRRSRNIALGVVLGLLALLFFGVTVVKMKPGLHNAQPAAQPATTAAMKP
jgi:uncharacterized protein involved in exopolysaccharide biosynthesis